MYVPDPFVLHDEAAIAALLRCHSFALLVTAVAGAPQASHLLLLFDPGRGPKGTLVAHLARTNPQASEQERRPAAAALRVTGDPQAQEIAALMESPAFDR